MNFLLIGKPNVGKSSIFNILTGSNYNIIHADAGTTIDWHQGNIKLLPSNLVFDSPGLLLNKKITQLSSNKFLNNFFLEKIDIFFYVIEYKSIFNSIDKEIIDSIRKYNKKIILLINKFDNDNQIPNNEILKYGIKNYFLLSCSHKIGFDNLNEYLTNQFKNKVIIQEERYDYSLSIFGKPNAGKSTLINTILGYDRSVTSKFPGTTSDIVVENFNYKNNKIKIIDTAGVGKKSNIKKNSITFYSVKKSFETIKKVDFVLIIIDSKKGIDRQDKRIINMVTTKAKKILIIFNKIDLIKNSNLFIKDILIKTEYNLRQIKNLKYFFISALSKKDTNKILDYIIKYNVDLELNISTARLNNWLKAIVEKNQHPLVKNKKMNFKYAVQINNNPVTVKIFCNFPSNLKDSYKRYLINNFNKFFNIINQNTKFVFSKVNNPFV